METENRISQIAMAVVAGIAAGAATWYFMTSENGKHNWNTFLEIAKDVSDKLADAGIDRNNLTAAGKNIAEYVKERAAAGIDTVETAVSNA